MRKVLSLSVLCCLTGMFAYANSLAAGVAAYEEPVSPQTNRTVLVSDQASTSLTKQSEQRRADSLAVFEQVCTGNLGDAETIHSRAMDRIAAEPFLGQAKVRGISVRAMFYPLHEAGGDDGWGDNRTWIINAGGLVCGIAADRALRFPQFVRAHRDVTMEKGVSDQFRDADVALTYGSFGPQSAPIRQYSQRILGSDARVDFIELIAPDLLETDRKTTVDIAGTFDPDGGVSGAGHDKLMLATVDQVCAQHLGDFDAMLGAAREVVGGGSLSRVFSSFSPYGQKVTKFVLKRQASNNVAILTLGAAGDMCGYWEVGRGFEPLGVFDQLRISMVHESGDDQYFERVGYDTDLDAAVIEQVLPTGKDVMRGVMYFNRTAYDQIPREYDLVSPWAF